VSEKIGREREEEIVVPSVCCSESRERERERERDRDRDRDRDRETKENMQTDR
jgi:hypothetical protein